MRKSLCILICFCLLTTIVNIGLAGESYKGKEPPSLQIIQKIVPARISGKAEVIGIHKERDGAYLVITDSSRNAYGGPYQLLRLQSNEWVIFNQFCGKFEVVR